MTLKLFSDQPPRGRCATLAQKLAQVSGSADAIHTATALFAFHHTRDNPVVVPIRNLDVVDDVKSICAEFGITAEIHGDAEQRTSDG